ncbi:hypothetical protein [Desulfovibrio sp. Huiquan2017]|uniref:hypothetical protein n=1 Tax=Desulfovibrio sp. Huiquan2017 TaxID=2816861 RepID=UPI001A93800F|nr:hypothetical protein [Desulfovibrio sp. Huiquan2017]
MPQVAARITQDQEKWLKDYFKTKSAGAEFILPWAVDVFFKSIRNVSSDFSVAELKTILESHKEVKLLPNQSKQAYLLLRVEEACDEHSVHIQHGASKSNLEVKLRRLTDLQATALMIWATAYWVSKAWNGVSIEDYVKLSCG